MAKKADAWKEYKEAAMVNISIIIEIWALFSRIFKDLVIIKRKFYIKKPSALIFFLSKRTND
jgi:hypothetical protein